MTSQILTINADKLRPRVDAVIEEALGKRIVGAVILVSLGREIIYSKSVGFLDREKRQPMIEDAIFRLASVSKLFVSVAAMVLVSQDKLSLEQPVSEWLPYFRPAAPDGAPTEITIRQLLTHTSGLSYKFLEATNGPYHQAGISDGLDRVNFSLEENLHRLAATPLFFEPGTRWNYSLATDVLGAVIAAVTETPLPEAVRALVLGPLGLKDTGFSVSDRSRLTAAYTDDIPEPRRMREPDVVGAFGDSVGLIIDPARALDANAFPSGGGGMVGAAQEVLTLLDALRLGESSLLTKAFIDEMGRSQTGVMPIANWPGWGFGLGFSVLENSDLAQTPESVGTWRWGGAYGHSWFVDRAQQLSVVALTNTAIEGMSGGGRFSKDLRDAVYW